MRNKWIIIGGVLALLMGFAGGMGYWMVYGGNTPEYEGVRSVKIPPESEFDAVIDSLQSGGVLQRAGTFGFGRATYGVERSG